MLPISSMGAYMPDTKEVSNLVVTLLVTAEPSVNNTGRFQVCLTGKKKLELRVPLVDIILRPEFNTLEVCADLQPGLTTNFRSNSVVSAWMDLQELVTSQKIDIAYKDGQPVFPRRSQKSGEGASWR